MTQPLGYDPDLDYDPPPYVPNMSPLPLPPRGTAPPNEEPPGVRAEPDE